MDTNNDDSRTPDRNTPRSPFCCSPTSNSKSPLPSFNRPASMRSNVSVKLQNIVTSRPNSNSNLVHPSYTSPPNHNSVASPPTRKPPLGFDSSHSSSNYTRNHSNTLGSGNYSIATPVGSLKFQKPRTEEELLLEEEKSVLNLYFIVYYSSIMIG